MENSSPHSSCQLESSSSNSDNNTLTPELRNAVFKNELIRDRIFDYVFTSDNEFIRRCGLVEHSWLDYITCRLQKSSASTQNDLTFQYWGESLEYQNRFRKIYQVKKFLKTWVTEDFPSAGSRVPLFNLYFMRWSDVNIMNDDVQDLIKCLMRCGNGLNSLTLDLEKNLDDDGINMAIQRGDFVADLGQLNLPNLKDIKVQLPDQVTPFVTLLLPSILFGCKRLTRLRLEVEYPDQVLFSKLASEGPHGQTEYLPDTLENIEIDVPITSELLSNLLLKNTLPNLTELLLWKITDNFDVVSRILHRFARQLKIFSVEINSRNETAIIKFPMMTKLTKLVVWGLHSELEPGTEQPFPILETFKLKWQSSIMMQKWIPNFQFSCVQDLNLGMNEVSKDVNFTLEWSQQLHVTFPHLKKLRLSVWDRVEPGSIQNIFQHLTQLCELSIKLKQTREIYGASFWDATLLGVSPAYANNLAETPREHWDSINLSFVRSPSRSIINLSRLTRLRLTAYFAERRNDLLISDVSFHFAFLHMPNLNTLELQGRFQPSQEMSQVWLRHGRQF